MTEKSVIFPNKKDLDDYLYSRVQEILVNTLEKFGLS